MRVCGNAEVKAEQTNSPKVCVWEGHLILPAASLTMKFTRETHIGTKCPETRCSIKRRIAAFQKHGCGGEAVRIVKCHVPRALCFERYIDTCLP